MQGKTLGTYFCCPLFILYVAPLRSVNVGHFKEFDIILSVVSILECYPHSNVYMESPSEFNSLLSLVAMANNQVNLAQRRLENFEPTFQDFPGVVVDYSKYSDFPASGCSFVIMLQ